MERTIVPLSSENGKTAKQNRPHKLELDNHRALSVTGVAAVPVFTDKSITVELDNETLHILGHDLTIKSLDIENGRLNVTGFVNSLRYTSEVTPSSVFKRIFK
jgi:sporulation protein YabP